MIASRGTDDLTEAQGKLAEAKAVVERGGTPKEVAAATEAAKHAIDAAQAGVDAASRGTDDLMEAQGKLDAAKAVVERGGTPKEVAAAASAAVEAANASH